MAPRERFSIDSVVRVLDAAPLSLPGAALIAAVSFYRARQISGPALTFIDYVQSSKWLKRLLFFVLLKSSNRALNRLVMNRGWNADKPVWSRVRGKGDIVLITGGSTGIGKELVEILAKHTSNIAVLDVSEPTYAAKNVRFYRCDVTDPKAISEAAKAIRADLGEPTIIVNNAGILRGDTLLNTTPEAFLLTYKVNVLGAHNILREFLPHLISINHGHVTTTASASSYVAVAQLGEYACSKAASLALHETLTAELVYRYNAPRVRTSVICPMKVYTQLGDALIDSDIQFFNPTLTPTWVGAQMFKILDSGLSGHLVAPSLTSALSPATRCAPAWFGFLLMKLSKANHYVSDDRNVATRKNYSVPAELEKAAKLASSA